MAMSKEEDKIKHSKRLHKEEAAIKHNMKIAKAHGVPVNQYESHRYAKVNGVTCGDPNCVMCMNPRKAWGEKTIQEKRMEQEKLHNETF
jgi:hypothetical protein